MRLGELETLKEAGSRGAGLRVLIGKRMGASYTSDLTKEGIAHMVRSAIDLADVTTEDPHAGLPDPDELGKLATDLKLFSDRTAELAPKSAFPWRSAPKPRPLRPTRASPTPKAGHSIPLPAAASSPIRAGFSVLIKPATAPFPRFRSRWTTA